MDNFEFNKLGLNNVSFLLWFVIIVVMLIFTPSECRTLAEDQKKEGFYTYPGYYKKYCSDCHHRSLYACGKCTNCGNCQDVNGYSECVPGDSSGPYFREDCVRWNYGSNQYYAPYSHAFPMIQTKSIFPYNRWNVKRNNWGYRKRNLRRKLRDQSKEMRELRRRLKNSQQ